MDLLQLNTLVRTHKYWPTGLLPKVTLEALGVGDHTATVQNVLIRVFIKFILFYSIHPKKSHTTENVLKDKSIPNYYYTVCMFFY